MLSSLVDLLSSSLQVATGHNFTLGAHAEVIPDASTLNSSTRLHIKQVGAGPTKQIVQLVADILQTASDLMLVRENLPFYVCRISFLTCVQFSD